MLIFKSIITLKKLYVRGSFIFSNLQTPSQPKNPVSPLWPYSTHFNLKFIIFFSLCLKCFCVERFFPVRIIDVYAR